MSRVGFLVGLVFGFTIAGARFNEYQVIQNMLLFRDFEPYLVFISAVAVAAPLLHLLERRGWRTPLGGLMKLHRAPVRRNNVLGAITLGAGWGLAGTCLVPSLAMLGSGNLFGLPLVAGIWSGIALRDWVAHPRAAAVANPAVAPSVAAH